MRMVLNKFLLSLVFGSMFCLNGHCYQSVSKKVKEATAKKTKEANLFEYVVSRYYDCDSFLIRYSPYRNLMGVLLIDRTNNGYRLEIFDIYTQKKIFEFEPYTMPIDDFRLKEDIVIVNFADVYGLQIAYDIFTGAIVWQTN